MGIKNNCYLEFNSKEELQNCSELQEMSRYDFRRVKLNHSPVFACTTNQQYEDIIWGKSREMLEELYSHFNIDEYVDDDASDIRDIILDYLQDKKKIVFIDVFDEY